MWLIDSGNSRVKARWFDPRLNTYSAVVSRSHAEVDKLFCEPLAQLQQPSTNPAAASSLLSHPADYSAIGVNVAGIKAAQSIVNSLHNNGYKNSVYWLTSVSQYQTTSASLSTTQPTLLINRYKKADQLGPDRWAAAVAAFELLRQTSPSFKGALIMHFGTATVLDMLSPEGLFLGGIIFPGWYMMLNSLAQHTAQLPELDKVSKASSVSSEAHEVKNSTETYLNLGPGLDTSSAMLNGCCSAHWGALKQQLLIFKQKFGHFPRLFITGGAFSRFNQFVGLIPEHGLGKNYQVHTFTIDGLEGLEICEAPDLVLKGVEYLHSQFMKA